MRRQTAPPHGPHYGARRPLTSELWQTEAFLKERGVPVNDSAADLEADNATLDKILARC